MTRDHCRPEELRDLDLFRGLHAAQLQSLCVNGRVANVPSGALIREGHTASHFYVLLDGEVVIGKRAGVGDVEIERTTRRGLAFGALHAYTRTTDHLYDCSVRLVRPSRLFIMEAAAFASFMTTEFPMAVELANGHFAERMQQRRTLGQRDAMLALGALTSGLTHQLSQQAVVIAESIAHLRDTFATTREDVGLLLHHQLAPAASRVLVSCEDALVEHVAKTHAQAKQIDGQAYVAPLTAAQAGEREQHIRRWLQEHEITADPDAAPTFVRAGLDAEWMDRIRVSMCDAGAAHAVNQVFERLRHTVDAEMHVQMIAESCERLSALVAGAKLYAQTDRGAYQSIDVHELLRGTLVMYGDRVAMPGKGRPITLVKDLHPELPEIHCYPADLNQAWSTIFDHAIRAMNVAGTLTLRTSLEGDSMIRIEISGDDGSDRHDIAGRNCDSVSASETAGGGAARGLDLARRVVVEQHHGTFTFESVAAGTRFEVRLPVRAPAPNPLPPTIVGVQDVHARAAGRFTPVAVDGN